MGANDSDSDESEDQDIQIQIKQKKKKKKQKKEKKEKKQKVIRQVTNRHAAAMDFDNDGIGTSGRIGIFCGQAALACFLVGLVSHDWTIISDLGRGKILVNGGVQDFTMSEAGTAKLGIWRFCFETVVPDMKNQTRDVCFWQTDSFKLRGFGPTNPNGGNYSALDCRNAEFKGLTQGENPPCRAYISEDLTICKHLGIINYCDKRTIIMWLSIALCALLVIADVISEKILINGIICFFSACCGAAMMALWMGIYNDLKTATTVAGEPDAGVEHGMGFIFMTMGFAAAFLGAVFCALDIVCLDTERFGLANDGIQVIGRFAALLGVLVWVLFCAGLFMADWATATQLGNQAPPSDLLKSNANFGKNGLAQVYGASWGLWTYCLEMKLPVFDNEAKPICMQAKENVEFSYMPTKTVKNEFGEDEETQFVQNGCEIFEDVKYCERSQWCVCSSIVAAIVGFMGDMFSEKQAVNAAMMFFTFAGGIINMVFWLLFVMEIDGPKDYAAADEVVIGPGFYTTIFAVSFSLVSGVLFYLDFADECQLCCEENEYQYGKTTDEQDDCDCYFCVGTGGSGYDNKK